MARYAGFTQYPIRTTAVLVSGLLLAFLGVSMAAKWYWLPSRMDEILLNAPEQDVPERMTRVLRQTSAPYRKLATWMGSDRPVVALEASRQLHQLIDQWEKHSGLQIVKEATLLVEALHGEISHYPDNVREDVHQIAIRMAGWDVGGASNREGAFLVAVERLINCSAVSSSHVGPAAGDAMLSQYLSQSSRKGPESRAIKPVHDFNNVTLNTGLPWNQAELPSLPRDYGRTDELQPVKEGSSAPSDETLSANHRVSVGQPLKLPPLTASPRHIDPGPTLPEALPDYGTLTTLEVIWKLHAQDTRIVQHARNELESRHFSAEDLELATRLSHPEIAERLQVVRELPLMLRDDRKTWLYYMTKDPDESVRYAAAAALITSSDPRLLRQLKADLTSDPSPRVQALIKR